METVTEKNKGLMGIEDYINIPRPFKIGFNNNAVKISTINSPWTRTFCRVEGCNLNTLQPFSYIACIATKADITSISVVVKSIGTPVKEYSFAYKIGKNSVTFYLYTTLNYSSDYAIYISYVSEATVEKIDLDDEQLIKVDFQ